MHVGSKYIIQFLHSIHQKKTENKKSKSVPILEAALHILLSAIDLAGTWMFWVLQTGEEELSPTNKLVNI